MEDKIKYRNRFYMVIAGILILIWVSVVFGFSRTIELNDRLKQRSAQLSAIQDAPVRLLQINEKLSYLESLMGNISGEEPATQLISTIGVFGKSNGLMLHEISARHSVVKDGITVNTYKAVVKGPFKNSLKLLDELQKSPEVGNIRSVVFESETDNRTGKRYLYTSYYLQSVVTEIH